MAAMTWGNKLIRISFSASSPILQLDPNAPRLVFGRGALTTLRREPKMACFPVSSV
jgi:hypothetical protein